MVLFWCVPALGVDVGVGVAVDIGVVDVIVDNIGVVDVIVGNIGVVDVIVGGAVSPNVVLRENVLFVSRPSMDRKTLAVVFNGEPV